MKITAGLALALVALSQNVSAHHGHNSQFDTSKEIEVNGIVTEIRFVNPHSYVHFDVTNESGQVENWRCEMRAANVLKRSGWSAEMFKPGTPIKINGIASRKEATGCYAETLAIGEQEAIGRYAQLTDNKKDVDIERPKTTAWGDPYIGGDWAAVQNLIGGASDAPSYLLGPGGMGGMGGPPGGGLPLSDAGVAAMAAMTAAISDQSTEGRLDCSPRSFFEDWVFDQHSNRIIQGEDIITLKYGFMDTERTIHMNLTEHPKDITPSFSGHSIGRWEDGVLVVDTVGFEPGFLKRGPNIIGVYSDQYHTVERFSIDYDKGALNRSYASDDPVYWADGATQTGQHTVYVADYPWEPYNCKDLTVE